MTKTEKSANLDEPGFWADVAASLKSHVSERLRSPFVGAFLIAWAAVNWKQILILIFSAESIESRIQYVADSTSAETALLRPLLYAAIGLASYIALSLIAFSLWEGFHWARTRIEKRMDSFRWVHPDQYIRFKAERQEQLVRYRDLAADQLDELNRLSETNSQLIAARDEALRDSAKIKTDLTAREAALLRAQDEAGALQAQIADLMKRSIGPKRAPDLSDSELISLLQSHSWQLVYNPKPETFGQKHVSFAAGGKIGNGRNQNESRWRIAGGALEILREDGRIQSRFRLLALSQIFVHTNDEDTHSIKGQYLVPDMSTKLYRPGVEVNVG